MSVYMHKHSSGLTKFGRSKTPEFRAHQLNNDLVKSVETDDDSKAEELIKRIYDDFRIPAEIARDRFGVSTSGCSEYYNLTNEDEGLYILDFIVDKHFRWGTSPFALRWLHSIFDDKKKSPSYRAPTSLEIFQTRDAELITSHYEQLLETISLSKTIYEPLVITPASDVISGNHRLSVANKLGLQTVPVVVCDDLWISKKEYYDLGILMNSTSHHLISQPLSNKTIQYDLEQLFVSYKSYDDHTLEDAFTHYSSSDEVQRFIIRYDKSAQSVVKHLKSVKNKMEEAAAKETGLFKALDPEEVEANVNKAVSYYNGKSTSVISYLAEKPLDSIGSILNKMCQDKNTKGVILTHRSYRQRFRDNSSDLILLQEMKTLLGISIQIEEMAQVSHKNILSNVENV